MMASATADRIAGPAATAPAVELTGLSYAYGPVQAVRGIDLRVGPGQVLAMLGPNGAGKSTTINMLLGLLTPGSGTARLFGTAPHKAIRAGRVAAMLQENRLLPRTTVEELLRFTHGLYADPMPVDEVLQLCDLTDLRKRMTEGLSGGQSQRVRFALAVIGRPRLLVLDEPTAALDVEARRDFWRAIDAYAGSGTAVLFSTHYLEEADEHAQRVVVIDGGRVIADGTPATIKGTIPGRTVRVDVTVDGPDLDGLRALPGVAQAEIVEGRARLRCTDADATVGALAAAGLLRNVEVTGGTLEDAFLSITHEGAEA